MGKWIKVRDGACALIGPLLLFERSKPAGGNQPYFEDLVWMPRSVMQWRLMLMKPLSALILVACPTLAGAQPVVPSAGVLLKQIQPATPPAASKRSGLTVALREVTNLPSSVPFLAQTLEITGNTLFATATLHALVADAEGKVLTLTQLGELADRITIYYQSRGYPLARAIIPAQSIMTGIVRIEVHEATYGKISLQNSSRVKGGLLESSLASLQTGKIVGQIGLDRVLLQIADIPGVVVSATLKPGDVVGTSDLLVSTTPSPTMQGNIIVNNYGDLYTGRAPIRATMNLINPLQHGDVLSFTGFSSGSHLNYASVAYEFVLTGQGTRVGGSYTALRYELGEPLASLNAHGAAQVGSLWAMRPLMRGRGANLYGKIQYDAKTLRDRIDIAAIRTDRHLDNLTLTFVGDSSNLGGSNSWNLSRTSGRVGFDDNMALFVDEATAKTQGGFSKWNASLARWQILSRQNSLYFAFYGQSTKTNLDPAEKFSVGGPASVRAYDVGALSGDAGYLVTGEFRHDLGSGSASSWSGRWQAVAFVDTAHVTINQRVWVAGPNVANLSGAGLGLNWTGLKQWRSKAYIATQIGSTPALMNNSASSRVWVEISKLF